MFRTDINHWLQQWDSEIVHWFFEGVSALGTSAVLIVMLYSVMIGINLKKGIGVTNMFFYVILLTLLFKDVIDFPRPLAVDNTLIRFDRRANTENLKKLQPKGFTEVFSDEVLQKTRAQQAARKGFPSGHTSLITAIMLGIALVFRRRWLWVLSVSIIILMMFSRMYLARHYLGDVLGGLTVGVVFTLLIYAIWQRLFKLNEKAREQSTDEQITTGQTIFMLTPLIFIPLASWFAAFPAGTFIGLNLGYVLLLRFWGMPQFPEALAKRIASVVIFVAIAFPITYISRRLGFSEHGIVSVLFYMTGALLGFVGASFICVKAKLWEKLLV